MSSERSGSAIASVTAGLQLKERWALYVLEALVGAAFILSALLLTERTTLAPQALIVAGAAWIAGTVLPIWWERVRGGEGARTDRVTLINPTTLFFAVVAATFTVHAMDAVFPSLPEFSANAPENLPGLATNFTPYFFVLLATVVLFVTWYGRVRERETEAGVATMVVYTSLAFELMLRTAGSEAAPSSGVLNMPMLWGTVLVLLVLWLSNEGRQGGRWQWTPFGGPLLALLAAAALSTVTSVYVHSSSIMLLRLGAFAALFWLVANVTKGTRQLRLFWLALVGPLAGAAFVVLFKLWELSREMGWEYVLSLRYQMSGIAGTNPVGLSLGIAVLLVAGAMIVRRAWRERLVLGLLLVILVSAFLAAHSPTGLAALLGGLAMLAILRFGYGALRVGPKALGWRLALASGVVAVLAVVLLVPNPYSSRVTGDVLDPTTGRSARVLAWQLAAKDFLHNPVLGVGLHNYYARTRYVDDFPSRVMTGVRERRVLLGASIEPWKNFVSFHPHNAYLAMLEGMGVFGLLALGWLGLALTAETWRLFRRAEDSFAWWAAAVPLTGVAVVLAWSFFAQGEDITVIGLPFWPLLGLLVGAGRLRAAPSQSEEGSPGALARLRARLPAWRPPRLPGAHAALALRSAGAILVPLVVGLAFLALVARPVAAELLVYESDEATLARNAPRALRLVRWAHRLDPWNAAYLGRLSDAYLRAWSLRDAIRAQEQVVETRRYFAPDHVRLGWFYWLVNRPRQALAQFQYAAELDRWDTTNGNVYIPLGLAYANAGQYEQALAAFAYGFQVSPTTIDDEAWVDGEAAGTAPGRYLNTVYLQRSERRKGNDPLNLEALLPPGMRGRLPLNLQRAILRRLGQRVMKPEPGSPSLTPDYRLSAVLDAIYRDYQARLTTDRDRATAMLATLGQMALKAGMPERSATFLEELRGLTPGESSVRYSLGLAYLALGDQERAKEEFRAVIRIGEESSEYVLRVPFSHFQLGVLVLQAQPPDTAAAVREFRDALDTYRWEYLPNVYFYLAIAEGLRGDQAAAEENLKKELFLLGIDLELEGGLPLGASATGGLTSR